MTIKKRSSQHYSKIFDVTLPVSFFFNPDGTFDGIEVDVRDRSAEEQALVKELCLTLAEVLKK